jgi:serralysin
VPNIIETTDANASVGTSYTLGISQTGRGNLSTFGDSDWYRVNLVAGQQYTAAVIREGATVNGVSDTYLAIHDQHGNVVWEDDDSGPGASSSITFIATTTGAYYLNALALNDAETGNYGISIVAGARATYDVQMAAGALLEPGLSWSSAPGKSAEITWSVSSSNAAQTDASGDATPFVAPSAAQISTVASCLAQFRAVCNVSFTRVNPGGTSNNATIRVNSYDSDADGAGAYANYPGSAASGSVAGDISLNNDSVSRSSLPQGSYSYFAILHELGHAMGLAHPGDYNAAPGVDLTYENAAQFRQDSQQYTVMSYFDESATTTSFDSYPDGLLLYDIYALQQLYGANMTIRTGSTVYGFHSNAEAIYDFAKNDDPVFCIWDAGGKDTIDASNFLQAQTINLAAGSFSNIGGLFGNVSVAYDVVIENAIGGLGNDTIRGNSAANNLNGGARNDKLYGEAGNDTLMGGSGNDTLSGGLGKDTLSGGSGKDVFLFNQATNSKINVDTITDFSVKDDAVHLDDAIFKAFTHTGTIDSGWLLRSSGTSAKDGNDFLIYETDTGNLYYDSNGSRAGGSVLVAHLDDHLSLTFQDFLIV